MTPVELEELAKKHGGIAGVSVAESVVEAAKAQRRPKTRYVFNDGTHMTVWWDQKAGRFNVADPGTAGKADAKANEEGDEVLTEGADGRKYLVNKKTKTATPVEGIPGKEVEPKPKPSPPGELQPIVNPNTGEVDSLRDPITGQVIPVGGKPKVKSPEDVAYTQAQTATQQAHADYYRGQTAKLAADRAQAAVEEKRKQLAQLITLGQIDANKAEKELDKFTQMATRIMQDIPNMVPVGSEFVPHLGPGSQWEKVTGRPARVGNVIPLSDVPQMSQGLLGLQGTPQLMGGEDVLRRGRELSQIAEAMGATVPTVPPTPAPAASLPPFQAPVSSPVWQPPAGVPPSPEANMAPMGAWRGDLAGAMERAAAATGVPVELIRAVTQQESGGNVNAVSRAGAQGPMQLMPETARGLGVSDPFDPEQNIMGGARYLKQQMDAFGGDLPLALAAYNAGPGAVQKYGGIPPYQETQDYVRRIVQAYNQGG